MPKAYKEYNTSKNSQLKWATIQRGCKHESKGIAIVGRNG
jgi:hypothetical protein